MPTDTAKHGCKSYQVIEYPKSWFLFSLLAFIFKYKSIVKKIDTIREAPDEYAPVSRNP